MTYGAKEKSRSTLLGHRQKLREGGERSPLPFVQIYADLMQAQAFNSLSAGARWCYLSMTIEAKGKREFEFTRKTAEQYGIAKRTLVRYVQELAESGFLNCKSGRSTRTASEYEFSMDWKLKEAK